MFIAVKLAGNARNHFQRIDVEKALPVQLHTAEHAVIELFFYDIRIFALWLDLQHTARKKHHCHRRAGFRINRIVGQVVVDYDLPNDTVYAETCASVAMVFFARRMLEIQPKGEYADIIEKELYNGVLSGMQLDGKRFFYVNPLEVVPGVSGELYGYEHVLPSRPAWYDCACCPPNAARLFTSLGQYCWGENEDTIFSHVYLGGTAEFSCAGGVSVACKSGYPWAGHIEYTLSPKTPAAFQFAVHVPAWCRKWQVQVNGQAVQPALKDGYAYLAREWKDGDTVTLELEIKARRVYANTRVRKDAGCVALVRGPIVSVYTGSLTVTQTDT